MDFNHLVDVIYFNIINDDIYKSQNKNDNKINREPVKRIFISDWELKRKYFKDNVIIIPENAILSPLSIDWIEFNSIKVIRR